MIAWAIETLVASTLLMLIVLVVRAPVRRAVGPQIAYALWSLPVLRMLLPPLPEAWRGQALPTLPLPEDITVYLGDPVAVLPVSPDQGMGWPAMLLTLWAIGAVVFAAWHMFTYARFCARLHAGARSRVRLASGRVTMIESSAAAGPLAFGVQRKYVAFPVDFAERYDDLERDLALAHELGHHARGDLLANWVALGMLALHWFNPVAWRAFRAFRADQEMACDALVLSGRQPTLRHAYGRAIVKSAQGGALSAACHLHTVNEIKGRLRMLTRHERPSRVRRGAGVAGIAAMTLGALALTASGTRAAETMKERVADHTGIAIDAIEMPALPQIASLAPPEPPAPPAPAIDTAAIERVTADAQRLAAEAERTVAAAQVPLVQTRRCGGDGPVSIVTRADDTDRVATATICSDRIDRHVAAAERHAADAERRADRIEQQSAIAERRAEWVRHRAEARTAMALNMRHVAVASAIDGVAVARVSIRGARAAIERNPMISDAQRQHVLAGLDEALREVEAKAVVE
ncbi:M56 family metallopeptidase [Sphingomonas sp.]|uniref:M56 family metallopeptidase n=1 Tax=Sphingomonas sp. TaxID=28214 RepID=UPI002CD501DD|nr:M56 family metallopeptidase [Sphingomonas sp.]HTG38843.1 M56 family metallopeptidase [Sphingomonas sp.]